MVFYKSQLAQIFDVIFMSRVLFGDIASLIRVWDRSIGVEFLDKSVKRVGSGERMDEKVAGDCLFTVEVFHVHFRTVQNRFSKTIDRKYSERDIDRPIKYVAKDEFAHRNRLGEIVWNCCSQFLIDPLEGAFGMRMQ